MKYVILSFLLSFFMVLFPPSDVALPSQLVTETDSHVQISVYPQETDSAKTPAHTKTAPYGLSKGYDVLSRMVTLLSVKPLDQFIDSTLEKDVRHSDTIPVKLPPASDNLSMPVCIYGLKTVYSGGIFYEY